MSHRTYCPQCRTYPFKPEGELCFQCSKAKPDSLGNEPWPPEPDGAPVTFAGQTVDAPGFSQDQFERAILRAFVDELQVTPANGQHIVHRATVTHGYRVTRERCDCKAGQVGTPCKHRAILILHLDIRMPAQQRQWAKLNAERPVRKAVASC